MVTVTKAAKDAKFFSNLSNARRALKKVFNCTTEVANMLIKQEMLEDGGRFWFSESEVNKAANSVIAVDKVTTVEMPVVESTPAEPVAPKASKTRSEVRNGVRKPIKGKCADVWAELDKLEGEVSIATVKALAAEKGWNVNNATIEFYAWRKFHSEVK